MISSLEEVYEIFNGDKVDPDVFWASIGYDVELISVIAKLGSLVGEMHGRDVPPGLLMASLQMGATLALAASKPGVKLGVEI